MEAKERIIYLYNRFVTKTASLEETRELFALIASSEHGEELHGMLDQMFANASENIVRPDWDWDALFNNAVQSDKLMEHGMKAVARPADDSVPFIRTSWFRYAAAVILIMGAGVYFWLSSGKTGANVNDLAIESSTTPADIAPGMNGAILTLADGSSLVLDSLANGTVATQNGARVVLNNGQLAYDKNNSADSAISYNTVSTPNGRQFHLVLPDGTKVWLNAASGIRFPTVFKNERRVIVTGEAYFDIAPDRQKAFMVEANEMQVQVLGTQFNINAYNNEGQVRTTLVEGSVKVDKGNEAVLLKPGQQAIVANSNSEGIIKTGKADIASVLAWKNGLFIFEDKPLREIMREISRWYDLEVIYEGEISDVHFGGKMGRDVKLASVLKLLKGARVNFRMENNGKRLVVSG